MNITKKFLFLLFFIAQFAWAEETSNSSDAASEKTSNFSFSGYLDTSYNHLLRQNKFTSEEFDRLNDVEPNGFTLQQLGIIFSNQPKNGLGGLLQTIIGRDASYLASFGTNPNIFDSQSVQIDIPQVYLQYAKNSWTTIVGKFDAFAGYEQNNPTLDINFSRSILNQYATPGQLMGFRTTYILNNQYSLMAGINNGWDIIADTSRRKTIELGLTYTPNDKFSLALSAYNGQERAAQETFFGPTGIRSLIDVVGTYAINDKISLVGEYDYGVQNRVQLLNGDLGSATWEGFTGYFIYKFNDKWQGVARGEWFYDSQGFWSGVRQNWREATAYLPIKALEFRLETRRDISNVNSFINSGGVNLGKSQQSYALEGIVKF